MKEREEKPIKKFLKDYEQKFVLAISHNFFLILSIIAGACLTVGIILFLLGVIPVPDISSIYRT